MKKINEEGWIRVLYHDLGCIYRGGYVLPKECDCTVRKQIPIIERELDYLTLQKENK